MSFMSFFNSARSNSSQAVWSDIPGPEGVKTILRKSEEKPQLIYKHSPRCSVSFMAKQELEKFADDLAGVADLYMVNVINRRDLSHAIASELNVRHESPQVIILRDREILWAGSHWAIKGEEIVEGLKK